MCVVNYDLSFKDLRDARTKLGPLVLPKDIVAQEGLLYFLLFRGIQYASRSTQTLNPCNIPDSDTTDFLPGWKLLFRTQYMLINRKPNNHGKMKPVSFIYVLDPRKLLPKNDCTYIILVRGTKGMFEWAHNLNYKQVHFIKDKMKIHSGTKKLSEIALLDLVREFRQRNIHQRCHKNMHLIFAGYSLGGAITLALSTMVKHLFPSYRVDAVTFGAPNIFNFEAREFHRSIVNTRAIAVDVDTISHLTCSSELYPHGMLYCPNNPSEKLQHFNFVTNPGLHLIDKKGFLGGYNVTHMMMSNGNLNFPIFLQNILTHYCAYACSLSKYCLPNTTNILDLWSCRTCELLEPISLKALRGEQ